MMQIYIADLWNNRIRKVDQSGIITTIAGNGGYGYSGDGGPATDAGLAGPYGVYVDTMMQVYIADTGHNRIRKVDQNGIITTIAGNGFIGYSGDGGPATDAGLAGPTGVYVDTMMQIYIADGGNGRIRKVDQYGIITTMAGDGNYVYLGDGGPATNASLNDPSGVYVDSMMQIYIADSGNSRIRKVDQSGIISTIAGNGTAAYSGDGGPATDASFCYPSGVYVDTMMQIYISDYCNNRIRKVNTNGIISTIAGIGPSYPSDGSYSGDGGPATDASLSFPTGVYVDTMMQVYIADQLNNRIRFVRYEFVQNNYNLLII
jgi:sugar lactone lactonase YvrE